MSARIIAGQCRTPIASLIERERARAILAGQSIVDKWPNNTSTLDAAARPGQERVCCGSGEAAAARASFRSCCCGKGCGKPPHCVGGGGGQYELS